MDILCPKASKPRPIQPIIETVSDILALEIRKTMDFYRATAEESEEAIQKILIAGGSSKLPGLPDILPSVSKFPLNCLIPFGRSRLTVESLTRIT